MNLPKPEEKKETTSKTTPIAEDWMQLSTQKMMSLRVERALFESSTQPHFFLHFQVTNLSEKTIAIDLRDKWLPIHPNQWGFSTTDTRQVIDERRMTRPPFDDAAKKEVIAAFSAGTLRGIQPKTSLDFYVEFNASGKPDVEKQAEENPYLIVSLDGELVATDGTEVERFSFIEDFDTKQTDLVIRTPAPWKTIPSGATLHLK